jgi:hypothetical protein
MKDKQRKKIEKLLSSMSEQNKRIEQEWKDLIVETIVYLEQCAGSELAFRVWKAVKKDLENWDKRMKEKSK